MRSVHAQSIRTARVTVGLTQEELGRRVGVKGRAIYRWERDATVPNRRHRAALIAAIEILNPAAAAQLKAAFEQTAVTAPPAPEPEQSVANVVSLMVLNMAEELDVSPRQIRAALDRLSQQLTHAGLSLDALRVPM